MVDLGNTPIVSPIFLMLANRHINKEWLLVGSEAGPHLQAFQCRKRIQIISKPVAQFENLW